MKTSIPLPSLFPIPNLVRDSLVVDLFLASDTAKLTTLKVRYNDWDW